VWLNTTSAACARKLYVTTPSFSVFTCICCYFGQRSRFHSVCWVLQDYCKGMILMEFLEQMISYCDSKQSVGNVERVLL